jgi:hypothetical protein
MRLPALLAIAAVVFILGCGGGPALQQAAQPETLEFKDLGGASVNYVADLGIDMNYEGSVISWLSTIDFKTKVDSITPRATERRFTFDKFAVTRIRGDKPEPDPNAPEYAGTTLWLQTDADGEIMDWKGLDAVRGRTVDGKVFKEYIVYQLLSMFQPPTDKPVNAGSTWEDTFNMEMQTGAVNAQYVTTIDYLVDGFGVRRGRDCAKIETTIDIVGSGEGTLGGKATSFLSEASGGGEIWFDYVNGVVVEYDAKTTTSRQTETERAGKEDIVTEAMTLDSMVKIRLVE